MKKFELPDRLEMVTGGEGRVGLAGPQIGDQLSYDTLTGMPIP